MAVAASGLPEVTLIFPAGLPDSRRHRAQAALEGRSLVGASSLGYDPAASDYERWAVLPYVHEPSFEAGLVRAIADYGITSIYSGHGVVADVLRDLLPKAAPSVRLLCPNPTGDIEDAYRARHAAAEAAAQRPWIHGERRRPAMPAAKMAGMLRLVDAIPGMTDHDKTAALVEAMRDAPEGDVVEIGSWWGRSAALLLLLARHHRIGNLLCIDPWQACYLSQGVSALDRASGKLDTEAAFCIFQANVSPLASGDANYLRSTAVDAAAVYGPDLTIATESFGRTSYQGRIALLHIDGNHALPSVEADVRLWAPHVRPGGWIVFDDYVWAFGNGPKRTGDAFINAKASGIAAVFVTGTALFVKLAETHP